MPATITSTAAVRLSSAQDAVEALHLLRNFGRRSRRADGAKRYEMTDAAVAKAAGHGLDLRDLRGMVATVAADEASIVLDRRPVVAVAIPAGMTRLAA